MSLRERIERVDVDLRLGADVDRAQVTRTEQLVAGGGTWPLTLLIRCLDDADERYQLSAQARGADGHVIAVTRASSAFVRGRVLVLGVHFDAECADRAQDCPGETSCQAGRCKSAFVQPESLPVSTPEAASSAPAVAAGSCSVNNGGCDSLRACTVISGQAQCGPCPEGFASERDRSCSPVPRNLTTESGTLEPPFSAEVTDYRVRLPLSLESASLTVDTGPDVLTEIDGRAIASAEPWTTAAPAVGEPRQLTVRLSDGAQRSRKLQVSLDRAGEVLGYLKASQPDAGDQLGRVMVASDDTLVVGAPFEDGSVRASGLESDNETQDAGAVYVFVRDVSGAFRQQAYLKADVPREDAQFGISVALEADRLVVGASGDGAGSAHIFERQNGAWARVQVLRPDAAGGSNQKYGCAVAIAGETIAVGAAGETTLKSESGAVYVYERSNGNYGPALKLKTKGTGPLNWFGSSVALGRDVLVGASTGEIPPGVASSGVLHVFKREASGWLEAQSFPPPDPTSCAFFGQTLALSDSTLATTCWNASAEHAAGAVYLYERRPDGTFDTGAILTASAAQSGDAFGRGIALRGDTMLVGAPADRSAARGVGGHQPGILEQSGAAYLFARRRGVWAELVRIKAPQPFEQDGFANAVALGGDNLLYIAASQDANAGSGVDAMQDARGSAASGAVHVFR